MKISEVLLFLFFPFKWISIYTVRIMRCSVIQGNDSFIKTEFLIAFFKIIIIIKDNKPFDAGPLGPTLSGKLHIHYLVQKNVIEET